MFSTGVSHPAVKVQVCCFLLEDAGGLRLFFVAEVKEGIGILSVFVLVINKDSRGLLTIKFGIESSRCEPLQQTKRFCEAGSGSTLKFRFLLEVWFWKLTAEVQEIKEGLLFCRCFYF